MPENLTLKTRHKGPLKFLQTTSKISPKWSPRFFQSTSKTRHQRSLKSFQITSKTRHKWLPRFFQVALRIIHGKIPEIFSNYFKDKISRAGADSKKSHRWYNEVVHRLVATRFEQIDQIEGLLARRVRLGPFVCIKRF